MACIPAQACKAALAEATRLWPNRNRASDGICGDPRHQRRKSDHNSGDAFDLTHDPGNGCDAHALVEALKARRDPRVTYIISNARIWNPSVSPDWRPYRGSNPHTKHAHVSIHRSQRDNTSPWWGASPPPPPPNRCTKPHPLLRRGAKGGSVAHAQALVGQIAVDGDYGPATEAQIQAFQREQGLDADGICGPQTWAALHRRIGQGI